MVGFHKDTPLQGFQPTCTRRIGMQTGRDGEVVATSDMNYHFMKNPYVTVGDLLCLVHPIQCHLMVGKSASSSNTTGCTKEHALYQPLKRFGLFP